MPGIIIHHLFSGCLVLY